MIAVMQFIYFLFNLSFSNDFTVFKKYYKKNNNFKKIISTKYLLYYL